MDRNIPHIRDIFSTSSRKKSGEFQDLCVYEKSPRSRRKTKTYDFSSADFDLDTLDIKSSSPRKRNEKGKENQKALKSSDETRLLPDSRTNHNSNGQHRAQYSSKTLTEKDIRHLERHLSMKKTIRKQISRNLAQAFVDNPKLFEPRDSPKPDFAVTLTRAKLPKSEQNVLDMLKISIDDRDSGHSSPTNESLFQDEDFDRNNAGDRVEDARAWSHGHRNSESKLLQNDSFDGHHKSYGSEKKSSLWKNMFSSRKNKR